MGRRSTSAVLPNLKPRGVGGFFFGSSPQKRRRCLAAKTKGAATEPAEREHNKRASKIETERATPERRFERGCSAGEGAQITVRFCTARTSARPPRKFDLLQSSRSTNL